MRINELMIYTRFGWDEEVDDEGPVAQDDVAAFLAYLASGRGEVSGETIHPNDRSPLQELRSTR